ncbi:MFS transporter [Brevibacillus dissolubilis]|uniref:MFS transporter n=1 Tax=Brevibacillus dissolubilis TaxID=1844116 RepID=UPI00111666CC|nr:MFS transporter [Brevibacillus dissolubilis]
MREKPLWSRDFIAVCLSSFFLFMTFYTLAVTLPIYVTDTLGGSTQEVGLVMTTFVIAAVIFRPLAGKWLDEHNRKLVIFASLALYMVCSFLYLGIESFSLLLVLRFVHGIGFGVATTATGAVAIDIVPEERKGEGIGYFSLFMSLAMVLGPFLGLTIMSHFDVVVLFAVCAVFGLIAFVFGTLTRVPVQAQTPSPARAEKTTSAWSWKRFIEPKAVPISVSGSILAFSYGALTTFISVYAKELGIADSASYFFVVFAAMIVLSRPFTGKWFDRFGENVLVYPGILLFTVGMILLSQVHGTAAFLLTGAMIGLGYGALLPSFQTIAIKASPSHRRGLATGTYFLLFDLGYGIGSYALGIIAAETSYHTMYLIAGVIVACTAPIYYGLHHKKAAALKKAYS